MITDVFACDNCRAPEGPDWKFFFCVCVISFCFRAPRRESELHYDMALYILLAGYLWAQNNTKIFILMLLEILKTISPVLCHSPYLITLQPVRERRRRCEKQSG